MNDILWIGEQGCGRTNVVSKVDKVKQGEIN